MSFGKKGLVALQTLDPQFLPMIHTVFIGRDKNVMNDYSSDIELLCTNYGINFIKSNLYHETDYKVNYVIAMGWRWLINSNTSKVIIFHDSLLPKLRGFNPLVTALINGHSTIGVTVIFGEKEYDTGDILLQSSINISYPLKIADAIDMIAPLYGELLNQFFQDTINNKLLPIKQNDHEATYSLWRDEQDYFIDWSKSADHIKRFIDAVGYPYKGACSYVNNKLMRIYDSEVIDDLSIENRTPGKVIFRYTDNSVAVVCGKGILKIKEFYDEENNPILLTKLRSRLQ